MVSLTYFTTSPPAVMDHLRRHRLAWIVFVNLVVMGVVAGVGFVYELASRSSAWVVS